MESSGTWLKNRHRTRDAGSMTLGMPMPTQSNSSNVSGGSENFSVRGDGRPSMLGSIHGMDMVHSDPFVKILSKLSGKDRNSSSQAFASSVSKSGHGGAAPQDFSSNGSHITWAEAQSICASSARAELTSQRLRDEMRRLEHEHGTLTAEKNQMMAKLRGATHRSVEFERKMYDAEDKHRQRLNEAAEQLRKSEAECDVLVRKQAAMSTLKSKLTDLQNVLNTKVLHLNQKQGEVRSLQDDLDAERTRSQLAEQSLTGMQTRAQQLEAELYSLKQSNNDNEATVKQLRDSLNERSQTAQRLKALSEESARAFTKVQSEKILADARIKDERTRRMSLEKELKRVIDTHEARVNTLEHDLELAQSELSHLRKDHAAALTNHAATLSQAEKASEISKNEVQKSENLKQELQHAHLELEHLQHTERELQSDLHRATLQAQTSGEACERAQKKVESLFSKLDQESDRSRQAQEEILNLTTRLAQLEGLLKAKESDKSSLQNRLDELHRETESEAQYMEEERKRSEALMVKLAGLQRDKVLMSEESNSAKATIARLQDEIDSLSKNVKRLQQLLKEQELEKNMVEENLHSRELEAQKAARNLSTLRNQMQSSDSKWKTEKEQTMKLLQDANAKLSALQKESNRVQRENQGLRKELDESKDAVSIAKAQVASSKSGIQLFPEKLYGLGDDNASDTSSSEDEDISSMRREGDRLNALIKKNTAGRTPMMRNYERKQTQQALKQGALFRPCDDKAFSAFMEVCTMMTFKSGSQIICEGEIGSLLFVIVQGEVRIWRHVRTSSVANLLSPTFQEEGSEMPKRKVQELIRRSVDQFFGEFAMVTKNAPRTANVTAVTFVKLVAISKSDYEKLNKEHNNVFERIFAPHKRDGSGDRHVVPKGRNKAVHHLRKRSVSTRPSTLRLFPESFISR